MRRAQTIVIVPSRTIEKFHEPAAETQAYEERLLCLLLMLRDPGLRVVYVTSSPVAEPIVDYYLVAARPASIRRGRARAADDDLAPTTPRVRPLSAKLLERPTLLTRIRWAIPDHRALPPRPLRLTELEQARRRRARHPGPRRRPRARLPRDQERRRASCSRAPASPHPLGRRAHHRPRRRRSRRSPACAPSRRELGQVVVKLDAGVSGEGNAIVELRGLPAPGARAETRRIGRALRRDAPAGPRRRRWPTTSSGSSHGGVVEERIVGARAAQPERPARARARGEARIVSTHDQILSGQRTSAAASRPSRRTRGDHRGARAGRRVAGRGRRARPCGNRLRRRARRARHLERLRDRDQPAQRRHDAPAGRARAALRRRLRRGRRRSSPRRAARRATTSPPTTSSRRGCARSATAALLRLAALPRPGRGRLRRRLPHAQRARRARAHGDDRDRQHGRRRPAPLRQASRACCWPRADELDAEVAGRVDAFTPRGRSRPAAGASPPGTRTRPRRASRTRRPRWRRSRARALRPRPWGRTPGAGPSGTRARPAARRRAASSVSPASRVS